jgi:Restriction endonuclease
MVKAGDAYRELVGTVMAALDRDSVVKTEQWFDGPDGERDMDVEVRGTFNGIPHFILIECKDHARPIGIGYIDAFESKIRDLNPDRAMMFSNSGFTQDALKKAKRVGIELASAMKARDNTVKIGIHCELIARQLIMAFESIVLFPFDGCPDEIEPNWKPAELLFDELPVIHWIREKMIQVAPENDSSERTSFLCTFRDEPHWSYQGRVLRVGGLKFAFTCNARWVAQTVRSEISLGYYDHLKRRVVIPPEQWYTPGTIDQEAWMPTDQKWEEGELEPNSFRLNITLMRSDLPPAAPEAVPKVDGLMSEFRVEIEQ